MNSYKVNKIKDKEVIILGDGNNPIWKKANSLTDFSSPWDNEPVKKIEFKAIHNSEKIFFQFKVDDDQTHIHLSEDKNDSINSSDRVELFFRSDASLDPYYCLEIDTTARIMDFKARPNRKLDFNWNWPSKDIEVKSSVNKDYFVVEIAISLQSLKDLNLLKDRFIETGIYRAKYNQQKDTSFEPTWITWVNPNTETPDFHTSTSFGLLELEN
ncbi:carbohydrate-binding family 9-like protein [Polaribacter sp. IC073]|uniref:carbohydrate-binding family 9-like protein n=1 Tax=Polaribacter sp. IC073 TaxID=2508540 RepID=UPI0011BD63B5|nr:carbohydrate-binding family 9-like protein [Polaribacter sp. IC073]TXD46791.1 endoxylanase [Polaribacter sp. IC073]